MDEVLAFLAAGLALAGSPGPATLSLAAAGAAFGTRRGLAYLAGIVLGMVAVMAVSGSGMAALVLALPGVAPVVTVAAALYFLWLAWRIATAPVLAGDAGRGQEPRLAAGVALSLVNPKGYVAMAALFSGFVLLPERPLADGLLKAVLLAGVMLAVNLGWLVAGAALTRLFREPAASRALNVTFALLLLASVAATLLW